MDSLEKLAGFFINAVVVQIKEDEIILRLETGADLVWPKERLNKDLELNQQVVLQLKTSETQEQERQEVAKALLQEVLKEESQEVKIEG